ncbi:MAG TPA: cytochrome c oxidase assembly protein [Terriglobales bacterium]|nr:cytochrome c oxidase assembly protein [Terriglobales bacterium]
MRLDQIIAVGLVTWTYDPGIVVGLGFSAVMYGVGLVRARHRTFPTVRVLSFFSGWVCLVIALISPLHEMGDFLFSAHMAQHELLMAVAAPLLTLGRPDMVYLWSISFDMRKEVGRALQTVKPATKIFSSGLAAWALHAVVVWVWHIPVLFDAALSHDSVHALQHFCFLGTALLFWYALLYWSLGADSYGAGIIYVFTTAIHTSILGALLTFSGHPWYSVYSNTTLLWGYTPLEDQQIGGLIMWVPAGLVYIVVGLWLFASWIQNSDRHSSFGAVEASRGV